MVPWLVCCLAALHALLYPRELAPPSYDPLAVAIDAAAHEVPLPGDDGVVEMARELAVLAATEGHFRADAVGVDFAGSSYGTWQVHQTTLGYLGATRADAFDVGVSAWLAARLVQKSHAVCRARVEHEQLGWFASGGPGCDVPEGLAASRVRVGLARWLRAAHPAYWSDATP